MLFKSEANYIKAEMLKIAKGRDITKRWKRARGLVRYIKEMMNEFLPDGFESDVYSIAWGDSRRFRLKKAAKLGDSLTKRYFKVIEWKEA